MKRLCTLFSALPVAAALLTLLMLTTAQANDFITPSPVPSSRDRAPSSAKTTKTPLNWNNLKVSNKIVKTTKRPGASQPAASGAGTGTAQ